jgi:hypothetical protein
MADRLPLEEPLRRALDAHLHYYEALGKITQEYWKDLFGIVRDFPVRFGPLGASASSPSARPASATAPTAAAPAASPVTVVLEAESGSEAQGVFAVENRLSRAVSTEVITSPFTDSSGRAVQPALRVVPGIVALAPGARTLVQIFAAVGDELEPGVTYRAEVNVPGLSERGIPIVLRRQASAGRPAAGTVTPRGAAPSAEGVRARSRKRASRRHRSKE